MANETNNLQIVIEAINKASAQLKEVEKDLEGLTKTSKQAGTETKGMGRMAMLASGDLKGFATVVGLSAITAHVAIQAFNALQKALKDMMTEAGDAELAWARIDNSLLNVSKTIGIPFSILKKSAEEAGLAAIQLGFDDEVASQGLAQLLFVTRDLSKAQELLADAENFSAQTGDSLASSIDTMSMGYQGLGRNLKKYGIDIDENTSKTEILRKLTATFGNNLESVGDTTKTIWGKVGVALSEIYEELGKPINEGMKVFAKDVLALVNRMADYLPSIVGGFSDVARQVNVVYDVIKILLLGLEEVLATVISIGTGLYNIATLNFKAVGDIKNAWLKETESVSKSVNETWSNLKSLSEDSTSAIKKNVDDQAKFVYEMTDKQKKAMEDLAKAYEKYMHDIENTNKEYEKSLDSLLIAHRDTWKQIKKDIKEENTNFKYSMEDMKKEFNKSMRDIAESHADKTKSILADMESERKAYADEVESINEEWGAIVGLTQSAGQDRLANLQAQLDKELALGSSANQDKIDALNQMIANEEQALQDAVTTQEGNRDEEIGDATDALDDRLTILEAELSAENDAYVEALADRQEQYDEDVQNAKDAHDDKIKDLESSLKEEEDIRKKYAKLFKELGDKMALDDITTLMNNHKAQLKEMEYQYQQQTKDLQAQLKIENDLKLQAEADYNAQHLKQVREGLEDERQLRDSYDFSNAVSIPGTGNTFSWANWSNLTGNQHGGVISQPSIVGEKNYPEVVLPLNEPQRMAEILKGLGISGGGGQGVIQNFNVTVNNQADVDMVMERALFNARYLK